MIYWYLLRELPSPTLLKENLPSLSTKIYDRNGNLLYRLYRDQNRTLINLSDLPPYLVHATLAAEDKSFYSHHGVSFSGIIRAFRHNSLCVFRNLPCTSTHGGSTITQQLVKNAFLSPKKTYLRKFQEAYLALWTERLYSKDEILEMYFNYVPYGGTAYGIEEAAHQYFGKNAKNLTLTEATLLAGLPVAPTTLSPYGTHPYLAKNRQNQVIDAMVEMGKLTDAEALEAKSQALVFSPQHIDIKAPHFVMYIKDMLVARYGEDVVSRGGLEVTTTLDLEKQSILEKEIDQELTRLSRLNVGNAAGMIADPRNGEILAMAGSHDFFDTNHDGQVNVALQLRQPGSSIKPITYSLAFMNGLTPNSRLEDSPVCFIIPGQPNYCPENYDKKFHGIITARTALASSYNIPAIKLLNSLGLNKMISLAREMGITTWNDTSRYGLSLTLGGGEVTMYDMVQVYSVLANGGVRAPLHSIISIKDHRGNVFPEPVEESKEILPQTIAYQVSDILSDPLARAPAFGTRSVLNIPGHQIAVKTGTTNNLRDNWTFGYTPSLVVATWVGNNDNTPMSSVASGITGASPIWAKTLTKLLAGSEPIRFTPPEKMVAQAICPTTGLAYCPSLCPSRPKMEYFVSGTEPKMNCTPTGTLTTTTATSSN